MSDPRRRYMSLGSGPYKDADPIFEFKDVDAVLIAATATDTYIDYLEKAAALKAWCCAREAHWISI